MVMPALPEGTAASVTAAAIKSSGHTPRLLLDEGGSVFLHHGLSRSSSSLLPIRAPSPQKKLPPLGLAHSVPSIGSHANGSCDELDVMRRGETLASSERFAAVLDATTEREVVAAGPRLPSRLPQRPAPTLAQPDHAPRLSPSPPLRSRSGSAQSCRAASCTALPPLTITPSTPRRTSLTESASVGALNLSEHRSGLYGEGSRGEESPRLSLSRPAARRLGLVGDEPGASAASSAEPEPDEVVSPRDDARKRRSSVRVSPLPQPLPPPAAAHAVKGDGSS